MLKAAMEARDGEPALIAMARSRKSADDWRMSEAQIRTEYARLDEFSRLRMADVHAWLKMYERAGDLRQSVVIDEGPLFKKDVREFWKQRPLGALRGAGTPPEYTLTGDQAQFLFCVFVRGYQYNALFGKTTPYYAHPIRCDAYLPDQRARPNHAFWSWGRMLLHLMVGEKRPERRSWEELLEMIRRVRTAVRKHGATWSDLGAAADQTAFKAKLLAAATDARIVGLPEGVERAFHGLAIAAATAAEWWSYRHDLPPGLGAMIEAPAVCYAREVTLTLQRVPFLRSRLYFPQLLDEGRAAKRSTAPNRTLAAR